MVRCRFALCGALLLLISLVTLSRGESPSPATAPATKPASKAAAKPPEVAPPGATKVLFLGNSFTFMWNVPGLLEEMGKRSTPKKIVWTKQITSGGKTLNYYWDRIQKHTDGENFETLLKTEQWDYVVLQRWGDDDVTKIVPKFGELIHTQNPKTKILLYAWLGDDAKNKNSDPEWVQAQHEKAAAACDATVIPVCWAWKQFRVEKPGVKDVADDGWHPGYVRAYMTASAIYATIFHESPVGNRTFDWFALAPPEVKSARAHVTKEEAPYLQQLAWDAVTQHSNDPFFKHASGTGATPAAK